MDFSDRVRVVESKVLHDWYEAVPDDRERMEAALDPEVEFNICAGWPGGGSFPGRRAVLDEYFAEAGKAWTALEPEIDEVIEAGDVYVVRGRYVGVAAETGASFTADFMHIVRLRDGRIVSLDQVADSAVLARARGC